MKRRFTILTAALALLVSLAIPMGMWGQTRTTQTAFYGFETGDAGWTANTFVTNNTAITAHGGSKYGATNGTTASLQFNTKVANPQSLTCYYSKTSTNTHNSSKFSIQVSTNNTTWTTVAEGLTMDKVTKGTWYELSADLSSYSDVYVRVRYDGTTAVRALDDITLIYDDGTTPSTDPEITFTPTSITLDEVIVGNEVSTTFSVAQANLTTGITLSVDNGSLSQSSIAQGAAATTVTWTYTPTTAGAISATVTATSGTTTEILAISGTAVAPVEGYDVDFEYATEMYPNWTFDNMTTYQTGSITAHGGTYYGTTGGKATASITTTSAVANPGTLTCYVSRQTTNNTSSTWYIQVSENGSTWIDVESHSATSMSQGSWVEFTADLTDYTDVYVRVYYSGSTAIRNIDDLTLTVRSSVADPTFSPVSGTTFGNEGLSVTISQADNENIYYTLDGTQPTTSSTLYSGAIALTATTTIKAIASDGTNTSNVVTATYTYVDPNAPGTVNNPYTVAQAIANTPSSGNVYIQGIVSSFYNTSIVGDGSNYRYYISDDGTTTTQLLVYKGKGLNQATFTNADDLLVGDEVVIYGTLITYQNAPEVASGNYLYSWNRPSTPTQEYTLTVTASENVEIYTFVGESTEQGIEGNTTQQVYNGTEIGLSVSASEGYVLTLMVDGEDVTSQLDETGYYTFNMPTHAVTVTATASLAPVVTTNTYTLATSIESGKQYIIVGWANGTPYAMGYDKGNNRHAVEISVTGDNNENASATIANTETNPHEFTITSLATAGYYSIQDATTSGYLYAAGSSSNHLKTEAELDANHNGDWKITISEGLFSIAADQSSNRNVMQFNNSNNLFACYASASQHPVYLYVKDETPVTETIELPITGYGTGTGNWYLIATPIGDVAPTNVANMLSNSYDLYYFDQDTDGNGNEWINYKGDATHPGMGGFDLKIGKGYLYANSEDVRLLFTGRCPVTQSTYSVTLKKTDGARFAGWNLVGNPYADIAYFEDNRDFYTMNSAATAFELIGAEDARHIQAMEGVFVTAEEDNEEVVFTTTAPGKKGNRLALNLSQGNNVIDRAFIRFGECRQLPKLQFNQNSTKVYIPMDDKDYAVVRAEEMGEMPVNFKAESNGTYSLNFGMDNVEFAYLHLIDNLTGNEVDLLQTPSYSFEAKTTDYENRFKLVFATGDNSNEDNFAYFSNGSFVINNEGNSTLQVIDITGRIVKSESVNGCANVNVNGAAGVYMLRLVNGDNVKVQKVVVK